VLTSESDGSAHQKFKSQYPSTFTDTQQEDGSAHQNSQELKKAPYIYYINQYIYYIKAPIYLLYKPIHHINST
jgi:hypothetical protein